MFEKLLQKILKDVIGQFTEEIDTNNLSVGIWSGQIQINKVKLNKNLFKKFGLPINVIFSFISQLKIKIPWKSFFSNPLIISIDSAFALCEIDSVQIPLQSKIQSFINSLRLIIANIGKKVIQKAKAEQDKQSGYLDTILLKMFDNLYLNIRNVHFRFQNIEQKFSFGMLLESIDIHAVDDKNKAIFIDRNKLNDKEVVIKRKFCLSKLRFYWQPMQDNFLLQKQPKERQEYFSKSSRFQQSAKSSLIYIFYVDLEGFILQSHFDKSPCYDIEVNQEKVQINLKKQIIEQFLFLAKSFQEIVFKENPSSRKQSSQCSQKSLKFLGIFSENYVTEKDSKSQKAKDQYTKQMIKTNYDQIMEVMNLQKESLAKIIERIVLKDVGKEKFLKSLDIKQFDFRKMIQQSHLEKEDQRNIRIKFIFKLPKALVYLFSFDNKPIMELNFSNTEAKLSLKNSEMKANFSVNRILVLGEQNNQILWINQKEKNALEVQIHSITNVSSLQVSLQKINILYNPKIINSIISFFSLNMVDSKIKNQALDKLQRIQSNMTKQIKKKHSSGQFKISLSGFQVSFVHNLHQLMLQTNLMTLLYDSFDQLYKINLSLIEINVLKNNNQKNQFNLIQPFDLALNYEVANNSLKVQIQNLYISLEKQVYHFLGEFSNIFSREEKKEMLERANIVGQIFVKQNRWKKTLSAIYQGKVLLWNENQEYPKLKMRIRKARQMSRGKLNYIIIGDKKSQIQIAFKTDKQYNSWKKQLQKIVQIGRFSQRKLSESMSSVMNLEIKPKQNNSELKMFFSLKELNLLLQIIEQKSIIFHLQNVKYQRDYHKRNSDEKQKDASISEFYIKNVIILFEKQEIFKNINFHSDNFIYCKIGKFLETNDILSLADVEIQSFEMNFDPTFVIRLNAFFHQNNKIQETMYIIKSRETLDTQDQEKILSSLRIKTKSSTINFINKKTRLPLAFISFQSLNIEVLTKYYEFKIEGKANSLNLGDLSGYPSTVYQLQTYQKQNIAQKSILSSKNSVDFQYYWVQKGSSKYDHKNQLLVLVFNDFILNFVNQPFMRIFDYVFVQLIGSIIEAEFFQQFSSIQNGHYQTGVNEIDFKNFLKNKDQLLRSKSLQKMEKEKLEEYLFHAQRFYLQLIFKNSTINLVSQNENEGMKFNINHIILENEIKLVEKQSNQTLHELLTQFHTIDMSSIYISMVQKDKTTVINKEPINLKILIEIFNKDLEYAHLYGQNELFASNMSINIDVQPCKLAFMTQNILTLKKIMLYNIFHDDGLDFLMIYDYMDFMPQMKISLKLVSDVFSIQIIHEEEQIFLDAGNFNFFFEKTHQMSQIHLESQYIVVGYGYKQIYEEVLTSRKNFGKFEPRKTAFRSFFTSNEVEKQNKQSIFLLQLKSSSQTKSQDYYVSIEEVMVVFNQKFLFLLKKISMRKDVLAPLEKVYKSSPSLKIKIEIPHRKAFKLVANKIMLCLKFPDSKGMVLAVLFTVHLKHNAETNNCIFPHLQSFVSNENQISSEDIETIKKRTILRPTQIKYSQNDDQIDFKMDRIFLKISVNDIQQLLKLYSDLMKKLNHLTDSEKRTNSQVKKSIKSISNESSNSATKNLGEIFDNSSQTIKKPKNITFGTFELMIINDLQENLIPLIYGNLIIEHQHIFNQLTIQFKMDFFNIRNSYWEPLIENTRILVKLDPYLVVEMQEFLDLSEEIDVRENKKDTKKFINVNISTNFIENFYKTVTNKQINFTKLYNAQQEIGLDDINSWVVVNQIGEDIVCKSIDKESEVYIPAHQSAKITFLSNLQESFNPNSKVEDKQREMFLNVVLGQKLQIKHLNINELGLKKIFFFYKGKRCTILKNLVVDISKNVRYLTLSSLLEIQNLTDLSIRFYAPIECKYLILSPKSTKFVPFNLGSEQLTFNGVFQKEKRQNSTFSPAKSITEDEQEYKTLQSTLQSIQKEGFMNFKLMSFKVKTRFQRMKKIVSLEPLYLIKNYLPLELTIILIDKSKESMINQYVINGLNSVSGCGIIPLFNEINDTQVSFYVNGYQWTNFQDFFGKKRVILKDFSQRELDVKIYRVNEQSKTSEILFYYPLILKNKTIQTIKVHSSDSKKSLTKELQKDQSQILLSRDITLQVDGGFSQEIYLKNHTQFFAFRKKFNNLKTFSKYFVYRNLDKINEDLTITQFKIFDKYLINNQTEASVILRPHPWKTGEIQTINQGQITNLLFFEIDSRLSVGSMFQFCPKDSQYEWSHPLNLVVVKQSTFFIRSRFDFKKLKHFILEVRKKVENCLEIIFKEVQNEAQIPYILINECSDKQIFVKDMLQKVDPGEQMYFNWDDPFQNNENILLQLKEISHQNKPVKLYPLNINTKQTSTLITCRTFLTNVEVEIIIQPNRKKIIFKDEEPKNLTQKLAEEQLEAKMTLPLRISLINNSITPVIHVLDLSVEFKLQKIIKGESLQITTIELGSIQVDNQANHNALYPVILSTQMKVIFQKDKNQSLQIESQAINLKIQEDFFKSLSSLKGFFQNLLEKQSFGTNHQLEKSQRNKSTQFFVSKLILPRIVINLQVQTKNFSIQTSINLQRPHICSFPWKQFPYPIKRIVLNVLTHLSISPWAFVTSFKKGIQILLTQQSTGRAFQGFFGTLLGAVSNSLSGILGFIVGYDVQRVDNLVDGIDQGFGILFREIREIPEFDTNSFGILSLIEGTGRTLLNIVFKPIKGVLRMTLKISEGIKKTAQFSFDQQTFNKTRSPIVFYNRQEYFMPYNKDESKYLARFKNITGNKLQFFYLVKFFLIPLYLDKVDLMLVMGTEYIVLLNLTKQTALWVVQVPKIVRMDIVDVCKIRIWAIQDNREEKISTIDTRTNIMAQKKKSLEKDSIYGQKQKQALSRGYRPRELPEVEYEVWMMNEGQAVQVVEMYLKVKKSSKIQF